MKTSYNWLQSYFEKDLPSPEKLDELIAFHSFETEGREVIGDDTIIDIDVLPNRAHDCLSHYGIAQEVSAVINEPLKETTHKDVPRSGSGPALKVEDTEKTNRYALVRIDNIEVKESPAWLKSHLTTIGAQPINNVVDILNYVMFNIGEPMHAFDTEKVADAAIVVRSAQAGEMLTTLSDQELTLISEDLIIADSDGPLGLAGIKGGKRAGVTTETTSILVEAAHFDAKAVRKSARRHNILTDASKRFENDPSPSIVDDALKQAVSLILELAGTDTTTVSERTDWYQEQAESAPVTLTAEDVNMRLGTTLTQEAVCETLKRLNIVAKVDGEKITVTAPARRRDLHIKEDYIEEVGRITGYKNIKEVMLPETAPAKHKETAVTARIRHTLLTAGFSEVMTYALQETGSVAIANPFTEEKCFARNKEGMEGALRNAVAKNQKNADLFNTTNVQLFEIGRAFESATKETLVLTLGVFHKKKGAEVLTEALKAVEETLKTTLPKEDIYTEADISTISLRLEDVIQNATETESYEADGITYTYDERSYTPYSKYPYISRDVAIWVPNDVTPEKIEAIIAEHAGDLLLKAPWRFDTYTKDDKTSYAFRLIFQSPEKTLTDKEVEPHMTAIEKALSKVGEVR